MKTIHELLNEGKQVGTLYHFTTIISACKIMENDEIKGGYRGEFDSWGISFTRDKNFSQKGKRIIGGTGVVFVVDGDKLSNKYKIAPFQYLGNAKDKAMIAYKKQVGDEMEELLNLGQKRKLENFSKYIIKVIFDINQITKEGMNGWDKEYITKLFNYKKYEEDDVYTIINSAIDFFEQKKIKIEIKK